LSFEVFVIFCYSYPWSRVLDKLTVAQLVKKFLAFFWIAMVHCRIHKSPSQVSLLRYQPPIYS